MTPAFRVLGQLWRHQRRDSTITCLLIAAAAGEEVRLLENGTVILSEQHADRVSALHRTEQLRQAYEARGWIRQFGH